MPRILDYNGQDADRTVTVASIVALKNEVTKLAQVTASTDDEAAAAEVAGIEMVVCMAEPCDAVRMKRIVTQQKSDIVFHAAGQLRGAA